VGIGRTFSSSIAPGGVSVAKSGERRALVEGDVLGLAAFDLVLRRFRACMVHIAANIEIARMDADDGVADAPGLGIPAHMIIDPEVVAHGHPARSWRCCADFFHIIMHGSGRLFALILLASPAAVRSGNRRFRYRKQTSTI